VHAPAGSPLATSPTAAVGPPASPLRVSAGDSSSASLSLPSVAGAATLEIHRDGRLLDTVRADGPGIYTDHLLWHSTTYTYEVRALAASGALLASYDASVTTPPQAGAFPRLYADSSFVNTAIPAGAAVDPASPQMVATAITPQTGRANLANSDAWGAPLAYATPGSTPHTVACLRYFCDGPAVSFAIPRYAQPGSGSDGQLTVLDPASGEELDMWQASFDAGAAAWSASSRILQDANGWGAACSPGQRCGGANAAGFAYFAGVVRPEEIAQGHIDHALALMVPDTRAGFVACPAVGSDGTSTDPGALPIGARLELDAGFDVEHSALPRWEKVIARALQQYGAYVVDTSGSLAIRAESSLLRGYDAWAKAGVPTQGASLSDLPWSGMHVLQLRAC
jgi:hypothetical protein